MSFVGSSSLGLMIFSSLLNLEVVQMIYEWWVLLGVHCMYMVWWCFWLVIKHRPLECLKNLLITPNWWSSHKKKDGVRLKWLMSTACPLCFACQNQGWHRFTMDSIPRVPPSCLFVLSQNFCKPELIFFVDNVQFSGSNGTTVAGHPT